MIIDAFMQLIMNNLQMIIGGAALAVISIAAVVVAMMIVESGASKLLGLISGDSEGPRVGYQYEEYVDGKPQYRTWTKKDQYYYDKARR